MGFPSPAADYVENRLSLDERFIHKPAPALTPTVCSGD